MVSRTSYGSKLLIYPLILLILLFLKLTFIFPLMIVAEEPDPNVLRALEQVDSETRGKSQSEQSLPKASGPSPEVLKALGQVDRETRGKSQSEQSPPEASGRSLDVLKVMEQQSTELKKQKGILSREELLLNLPPDTVLATLNGEPLVSVEEFNKKVTPNRGEDLFGVRYKVLRQIIETKLVAAEARNAGFKMDPLVRERLKNAQSEIEALQRVDKHLVEIDDDQVQQYYKKNLEKFRQPDRGTRVLFVVKGTFNEAADILKQLKKGEPIEKVSFSPRPIFGSLMPARVQEAIFHLEPGQLTEVVRTPIGFYIVKLVERNPFDQFKVSVIVKNTLQECQKTLKRIEGGEKFEDMVVGKKNLSMGLRDLPEEAQMVVPGMELQEVSQPVSTYMGYFLVKLQERQSNAEIETAKLIRVDSKVEGEKILASLKKGIPVRNVQERKITGKEIPNELRDIARGLKEGEYSVPIKTQFGYYLVKVEKRVRQKFKPFNLVREEAKKMITAETISDDVARQYYGSHRAQYRKSGPDYMVDLILVESLDQGGKILAELKNVPEGEKKEALFIKYQKDLKEVSVDLLPVVCKTMVRELKFGQSSPVIATHLGYFILRLRKIESPGYFAFEEVQYEVKSSLALQKTEQTAQRYKREVKFFLTQVEEEALKTAYYSSYMQDVNKVSAEEAEEWWRNNKTNFLAAFGAQGKDMSFATPEENMRFKKRNALLNRYRTMIEDLYVRNNVVIYENRLH